MSTLYIRNVPDEVRRELGKAARRCGHSVNKEAILTLRRGLNLDQLEREALISEIESNAPALPKSTDISALIREDRDSR